MTAGMRMTSQMGLMMTGRLFAIVLIVALPAAGCGGSARETTSTEAALTAQRESLDLWVPAAGALEAVSASPIAVPRVPTGALKVKELVPEGSIVAPGDIVLVFDDTQLNIELHNNRASFRSADRRIDRTDIQSTIEAGSIAIVKELARLERDHADTFQIVDEDIFSRLEILQEEVKKEDAEETIVFADASLLLRGEYYDIEKRILDVEKDEVKGKIDRVQTSLGNLVLKTPIGGLVLYKKNWRGGSVAVGDTLWPGNVVMMIVDPSRTVLTAYVLEKDAASVQKGARAAVTVDARPDRVFQGQVRTIAEVSAPIERDSPVKYCEVKIDIEDGDPDLLKPGMKGEARIVTGRVEDAVVLPRTALRGPPDGRYVLVHGSSGPERRSVTLGPGDLVRVSIAAGLQGGETVLLGAEPETLPAEGV